MANQSYVVQIGINSQGARVVVRDLQAVTKTSNQAGSAVAFFKRQLLGIGAFIGGALGLRKLAEYADTVTNLKNRLSILNNSTFAVNDTTEQLFRVARDTRTEFDATAQVYSRLALSARTLGETQASLLRVTETLNQAVILSGANSREAANGLIQLSQAIASNRLGGDELRSVLEQLPLVADIIGERLKKIGLAIRGTRGEVRQLGFEGRISARIIVDALKDAEKDFRERFANTVPTISQAFTVLRNSVIQFVSDTNDATGAASHFANVILLIADNLGPLSRVAFAVGAAFATWKLVQLTQQLFKAAQAAAAFQLGLAGWVGLAVLGGIALFELADAMGLFIDNTNDAGDSQLKEVSDAMKDIDKFAPPAQERLQEISVQIKAIDAQVREIEGKGFFRNLFEAFYNPSGFAKQGAELKRLRELRKNLAREALNLPKGGTVEEPTKEGKEQADLLAKIKRQLNGEFEALKLGNRERQIRTDLLRLEEQLIGKGFKGKQLADAKAEIEALLRRNLAQQEYAEVLDRLRGPQENFMIQQAALLKIMGDEPTLVAAASRMYREEYAKSLEMATDAQTGLTKAIIEQELEFENLATGTGQLYRELTDPALEYARTVEQLNTIVAKFPELQEAANRKLVDARIAFLETETSAAAGIERGFLKIRQEISDTASLAEDALTSAFSSAKDSLIDFFQTGELKMGDFVDTVQRKLLDLALSGLINDTLGGIFQKNGGGIGGFLGGLFGGNSKSSGSAPALNAADPTNFARGGSFTVGGMGGIDSQTVAFRATPGERVTVQTPSQVAAGGPRNNVTINVHTQDAASFERSSGQILSRMQRQLNRAARRDG